jgi:hypothetical protein
MRLHYFMNNWLLTKKNWVARTNRLSNCTFYSNKPSQHCLPQGITAPGGVGYGEEIRAASQLLILPLE